MQLHFLCDAATAPQQLLWGSGKLFFWGKANLSWQNICYQLEKDNFPTGLRGNFAFIWLDANGNITAATDHLCTVPLFYTDFKISNIFSVLKRDLKSQTPNQRIQYQIQFLGGQSFGDEETTIKEIKRIQPGHYLKAGQQFCYIDFAQYAEPTNAFDLENFTTTVEKNILANIEDKNCLLLSGGTDSVTISAILKKYNLLDAFRFLHIYSTVQQFSDRHLLEKMNLNLPVEWIEVPFSGDILPSISDRQFSFWVENPFPGKRMGIEKAGASDCAIFTGEIGDQLFGGPKNAALVNYALQAKRIDAYEIANIWINQSASYGLESGTSASARLIEKFKNDPQAKIVHEELCFKIATLFEQIKTKDYIKRLMLMNYIIKGPYRAWAYSQDSLKWKHPFMAWDIFALTFSYSSKDKYGKMAKNKGILWDVWGGYMSDLPWRAAKNGFGIPARSKLRNSLQQH